MRRIPTYEILDTYVVLFDLVHCYIRLLLVFTTTTVLYKVCDEHFLDFIFFDGKSFETAIVCGIDLVHTATFVSFLSLLLVAFCTKYLMSIFWILIFFDGKSFETAIVCACGRCV